MRILGWIVAAGLFVFDDGFALPLYVIIARITSARATLVVLTCHPTVNRFTLSIVLHVLLLFQAENLNINKIENKR